MLGKVLAWFCLFIVGLAVQSHAQSDDIRAAVQFALQCNATVGEIQNVAVLSSENLGNGLLTVRGTYSQKVGGFSLLHFTTPDATGGVFEGAFNPSTHKLESLQFKISLRAGTIPAACLR
jgi:hypothetical protein